MGIKNFVSRKIMERQVKNLPVAQREIFLKMFEQNPELFEKIALEIKENTKNGQDEMLAAASVMKKYQPEMQKILSKIHK